MKVKSCRSLYHTKFLEVIESTYVTKNDNERKWFYAERPHGQHAVMIPAVHGNKLVLIREFRVPVNSYVWGFPAGLIDPGEGYYDTLVREIVEETGMTVKRIIRDDARLTRTSPGVTSEGCYFVFVEVEGTPSTENLEESEDIEIFLMSRNEVKEVIESGDNIDSKAYLIMTRFVEDGRI